MFPTSIREDGEDQVTMTGGEIYLLLFDAMDVFYHHGVIDVRERHGIR